MRYQFQSTLSRPEGTGTWTYLDVPIDVSASFGSKGQIKVKGTVDGQPFRSTLMPGGDGGHFLVVNKALRDAVGKQPGDTVAVTLEPDDEPREIQVPDDFQAALALNAAASEHFAELSYSHKKRYVDHIGGAKAADTRMNRIDKAVRMLAEGRKMP